MKTIEFKDLEWIVLEENEDTTRLLLKDVLDEERIKKYSNDDWYIDGCYVAHSDNARPPFDWNKSYIKNVILEEFKKDLDVDCEIDLLSREEIENLNNEVKQCNRAYWTKSDASDEDDRLSYAWNVIRNGSLSSNLVDIDFCGLRPVIILKSKYLTCDNEVVKGKLDLFEEQSIKELDINTSTIDDIINKINEIIKKLEL